MCRVIAQNVNSILQHFCIHIMLQLNGQKLMWLFPTSVTTQAERPAKDWEAAFIWEKKGMQFRGCLEFDGICRNQM